MARIQRHCGGCGQMIYDEASVVDCKECGVEFDPPADALSGVVDIDHSPPGTQVDITISPPGMSPDMLREEIRSLRARCQELRELCADAAEMMGPPRTMGEGRILRSLRAAAEL